MSTEIIVWLIFVEPHILIILELKINPFHANIPFLYPQKCQKTSGIMTFSECMATEHRLK